MRVLMTSHGYPPTVSGVTLVVQKIARGLVARGHQVMVVTATNRDEPYRTTDDGVQLIRVGAYANPYWPDGPVPHLTHNEMMALLGEFSPDVLHVHDAALLGLRTVSTAKRSGLPILATCYYVPEFVTNYLSGGVADDMIESLGWAYSVWLFNRCTHVVFGTQAHRRLFLEQGLEAPSSIITNGIDTARYHRSGQRDPEVERRYQLPEGPRLLFVGRLARDKRIDILLETMVQVRAHRPDAHLVLVGKGPDRERLEKLVVELGLQQTVHFLGFVPDEDLPAIYRAANVFVIASTCEVQSLPTLEALATGLPVVAANAVALPEIVIDGVDGYLVPPLDPRAMAQAVLRLLDDPALAHRLGQAGCAIAQEHANKRTVCLYERTLAALCHSAAVESVA